MYARKTFPDWYEYRDSARVVALLDPDGAMNSNVAGTALEPLATLAAAIHSASGMLSEFELRHAEQFIAMHRWRSATAPDTRKAPLDARRPAQRP